MATGTRREARERAVELLYEADTKDVDPIDVVDALPLPTDPYAVELARGVVDHRIEIDAVLGRLATNWSVARMAAMDRTVLRLGVLELATQLDVPRGACLAEAVELGGRYGSTDDTSRFVNGVLAKVADEVRGTDGAAPARPWSPIDVVVFDMDGVIRHWTGEDIRAFEAEHGLPDGAVGTVAFAQPLFGDAMTGTISGEEWAAEIGRRLAEAHAAVTPDAGEALWRSTRWAVDDDVVSVVRDLRAADQRVALFSNATTLLERDLATIGIDDCFDHVANSARIGLVKPEVAAFERVAADLGVEPARLLFVDDRPENVAGAVAAGWHAVRMPAGDGAAARLRGLLARLGVAGAADAA